MPAYTPAFGLSSDGTVVAGHMQSNSVVNPHAYRWAGTGLPQDLGVLPTQTSSYAYGVSGDGNTVVGTSDRLAAGVYPGQAFRWTEQTGMQGLGYTRPFGFKSEARAISRDGSTVVGFSESNGPFSPIDAFVWTQAEGMRALPQLPGAPYEESFANAVNRDGTVIVGSSPTGSGYRAVRWTSHGVESLGLVPQIFDSRAHAVSDAGDIVGGDGTGNGSFDLAFVWTPTTGMRLLSDYLTSYGVAIPAGYRLEGLRAISGDGLTFAGFARNLATSHAEGFVATVPPPASVMVLVLPVLAHRRRRPRV